MTSAKRLLTLKIDVDTLRGTREGVPRLARLLTAADAQATFVFSVGPDRTGRALRRIFRAGFLEKVSRTSVLEHYGLRTLLYGTVLPGPHIGRSCAAIMRSVRADGFEVGLHSYDHVEWQDFVSSRDAVWTRREMQRGIDAFGEIFGESPRVHAAAGWQMNEAAFALEVSLGFECASDTRGTHPFIPIVGGEALACPQFPTTLPTLDELIGVAGNNAAEAASHLLELTKSPAEHGHVFTLHAELEGMKLMPLLSQLVDGWKAQGYELVTLGALRSAVAVAELPRQAVMAGCVAGRSGTVMMQMG
jgi:peptidoglycan/xylan/chitin deacetylase (PgdA/CDA1 family)